MVHSRLLPIVVLACSAFTATVSVAQTRFALDPSSQRVIGISGLPTSTGCFAAKGSGIVVERQVERGDLSGFLIDMGGGERSYINLPDDYEFRNRATHVKAQAAFAELLRVGNRVSIGFVACGAAGRIMRLTSLSAVAGPAQMAATPPPLTNVPASPPAASPPAPAPAQPAATPTKWRMTSPTAVQHFLEISSDDRKFRLSLNCMNRRIGGLDFGTFFQGPRNWSAQDVGQAVSIDGQALSWELGGADEGYVLSDKVVNNAVVLSAEARLLLAKGQRLVINGKTDRGPQRHAAFTISGGDAIFARFEDRCRALPVV